MKHFLNFLDQRIYEWKKHEKMQTYCIKKPPALAVEELRAWLKQHRGQKGETEGK